MKPIATDITPSAKPAAAPGRRALIVGGGTGLGLASSLALAARGWQVFITGRRAERLQQAQAQHPAGTCHWAAGDATLQADVQRVVAQCAATLGGLDALVVSAGQSGVGSVLQADLADFDRVMAVNVRGVFNTMKAWLPGMVSRGSGSVVNLASTAGLEGLVDRFAYSVSKHAVVGITRSAALDHARSGVRINCLCPGRVETPFVLARIAEYPDPAAAAREMASTQAMGRMGQPQEIADAALFLASDAAAFITGVALPVDGGWTAGMFPKA
jgi:NAD(P)-dependent dehydrogenase (short-subunit alcohol dehydrogenase family)